MDSRTQMHPAFIFDFKRHVVAAQMPYKLNIVGATGHCKPARNEGFGRQFFRENRHAVKFYKLVVVTLFRLESVDIPDAEVARG